MLTWNFLNLETPFKLFPLFYITLIRFFDVGLPHDLISGMNHMSSRSRNWKWSITGIGRSSIQQGSHRAGDFAWEIVLKLENRWFCIKLPFHWLCSLNSADYDPSTSLVLNFTGFYVFFAIVIKNKSWNKTASDINNHLGNSNPRKKWSACYITKINALFV